MRISFIAVLLFLSVFHVSKFAFASTTIKVDGSTGVKPLIASLAEKYQEKGVATISLGDGLNPTDRIAALKRNDIDIAMASHGIDVQTLTDAGYAVHLIAKVAVVIGVNESVMIDNLSEQELCGIYSGNINNWQTISDTHANALISAFIRPFNEVDTEVLVKQVACFSDIKVAPSIKIKKKSGHMAKALATTSASVGMTTLIRVAQSQQRIKALSLNGIAPSSANVSNGHYPLSRDLFLITKETPSSAVKQFLNFIKSSEGAKIIQSNHAAPAN